MNGLVSQILFWDENRRGESRNERKMDPQNQRKERVTDIRIRDCRLEQTDGRILKWCLELLMPCKFSRRAPWLRSWCPLEFAMTQSVATLVTRRMGKFLRRLFRGELLVIEHLSSGIGERPYSRFRFLTWKKRLSAEL